MDAKLRMPGKLKRKIEHAVHRTLEHSPIRKNLQPHYRFKKKLIGLPEKNILINYIKLLLLDSIYQVYLMIKIICYQ